MNSKLTDFPKITVLMPVYNCELYVREAIESILNQTFTDFELLIIDDGSTDDTVATIRTCNDSRIQLIEKPFNTGLTNSLNQGLKMAKGKYIARMDGDDSSKPERFANQVAYLDANPECVLCATAFKIIGSESNFEFPEQHEAIKLDFLEGNPICHSSVMMRKETLDAHSIIYDKTKEPAEDYEMWIRLSFIGELYMLPEILVEYRVYDKQVSFQRADEQMKLIVEMSFQLLSHLNLEINPEEHQLLEKYFRKNKAITLNELSIFKQLQKKLRLSNNSKFFEPKIFMDYVTNLEVRVINLYFKNYVRYNPALFIKYLQAKLKWKIKMAVKEEFKLFVKCMIFKKNMRFN
jgi:glycosyltransferase involved in cell wall biosynthesis